MKRNMKKPLVFIMALMMMIITVLPVTTSVIPTSTRINVISATAIHNTFILTNIGTRPNQSVIV